MILKRALIKAYCLFISIFFITNQSHAWNALGHRLVAEIAYENISPLTRKKLKQYNDAVNQYYKTQLNFTASAVWLDWQKKDFEYHYINVPFSPDNTRLIPIKKINALTAINEALFQLNNPSESNFNKGLSLRVLLHVVADIHQPLHAATLYSKEFPHGDKGGNLLKLKSNPIAANLHGYWDKGGGFLKSKRKYPKRRLIIKAKQIQQHYPCQPEKRTLSAENWINESHNIAVNKAYQTTNKIYPDYQKMVKQTSEQRIAVAGCRLAALLNQLK